MHTLGRVLIISSFCFVFRFSFFILFFAICTNKSTFSLYRVVMVQKMGRILIISLSHFVSFFLFFVFANCRKASGPAWPGVWAMGAAAAALVVVGAAKLSSQGYNRLRQR